MKSDSRCQPRRADDHVHMAHPERLRCVGRKEALTRSPNQPTASHTENLTGPTPANTADCKVPTLTLLSPLAAHRRLHPVVLRQRAVRLAGALTTAIGMHDPNDYLVDALPSERRSGDEGGRTHPAELERAIQSKAGALASA